MVETRIRWNGVLCTFIIFTIAFLRNHSNTKVKKLGRVETRSSERWKLESKQRNSTLRFEIYVGRGGIRFAYKSFLSAGTQWIFKIEYAFGILLVHGGGNGNVVDAGKIDSLGRGGGKRVEESRNEPWRIEISEKNLECREKEKGGKRERERE